LAIKLLQAGRNREKWSAGDCGIRNAIAAKKEARSVATAGESTLEENLREHSV
jgi:hypothetical protein